MLHFLSSCPSCFRVSLSLHVYVHEGPLCVHYQSDVESLHFFLSFFTFYPHYRARLQSDYAPYHVDLSPFTLYRCIGEHRAIHCPPDICSYAPLRLASFDCASNTVLRPNQECGRVKFSHFSPREKAQIDCYVNDHFSIHIEIPFSRQESYFSSQLLI